MYLYIFCDFPIKHFLLQAMELKKNYVFTFYIGCNGSILMKCYYQLKSIITFGDGDLLIKFKFDFLNVYFLNHF